MLAKKSAKKSARKKIMFSTQQRQQYNGLMMSTRSTVLRTGPRASDQIVIDIGQMTPFLVANFPGFRMEWERFITDTTTLRVHKVLERADDEDDTETMRLLLEGKRTAESTVDSDLKDFLHYHISHAQICWRHFCNAEGCTKIASSRCGKCKAAAYCSRECQVQDWRQSHKWSCHELVGWKSPPSNNVNQSVRNLTLEN